MAAVQIGALAPGHDHHHRVFGVEGAARTHSLRLGSPDHRPAAKLVAESQEL
jgi:hypothetical protein